MLHAFSGWDAKAAAARALAASVAGRLVSVGIGGSGGYGGGVTTKHVMVSNQPITPSVEVVGSVIKAIMAESGAKFRCSKRTRLYRGLLSAA